MRNERRRCTIRRQDGSVLLSVMCVMMILSLLSMALLKTSSDLVHHHRRRLAGMQCELLALSTARVIQEQIEATVYEDSRDEDSFCEDRTVYYDLQECGLPAEVSLEIRETADPHRLYVTVICEMDDVSERVVCRYYAEDKQVWRWKLERME